MSYLSAFPDYDGEFYCPLGWEDHSYKNDTCPRAMYRIETKGRTIEFSVWNDYVDPDKREYENSKRYVFQIHIDGLMVYNYETDELNEIKLIAKGVNMDGYY